jgi:heavy metal sensor kinase
VVGLLEYWLAGRILAPVRSIAETARSLSERDLHRRVEVRVPPDELGELVATFNQMLERLEASFESLRRFTADASHELRAPLTMMSTDIQVALTRPRSEEAYRRTLLSLQQEVEELNRVVDHLLMLARADAGAVTARREPIDVADFIHETSARWEATARRRRVKLEVDVPGSGTFSADPALTRRIVDNLIGNAIRHTPTRGRVQVSARQESQEWVIDVVDEGPGIQPGARDHLFARFGKTDDAHTPDGGGAGLGLAVSAVLAQVQGGELRLVDTAQGADFRLRLPQD